MQTSEKKRATVQNHRKVQTSTTLNRKYTKRPTKSTDVTVKVTRSPKIKHFNTPVVEMRTEMQSEVQSRMQPEVQDSIQPEVQDRMQFETQSEVQPEEPIQMVAPHPIQSTANAKMRERAQVAQSASTAQAPRVTAKELKDQAIQKALASAERMQAKSEETTMKESSKSKIKKKMGNQAYFGFGRVMLATACAAAAVFAIVYFVNLSMPDISMRVAAMQTGMDPTYPNYIPRNYNVSSITSEDGKITMDFTNSTENTKFTLIEEKSSWDTNALASNFVKEEYGENYSVVREQGLTIYISGSNAAWVNGGMVYKIKAEPNVLSNKQIRSIAVSL